MSSRKKVIMKMTNKQYINWLHDLAKRSLSMPKDIFVVFDDTQLESLKQTFENEGIDYETVDY